jgi:biopolymer transport protein ExbD
MRLRTFHPPHPFSKINVTPMIDVVMVLIIFYLIVGKLAADQRSNIRLPESRTGSTEKAQERLVINVLPAGVVIEGVDVPAGALEATIKERLAGCKAAGVESVRLATERAQGANP